MRNVIRWALAPLAAVGVIAAAGVPVATGGPAPAPDGKFVLGNLTATENAQLQLWGAQWWKAEDVTGGAPASFKGWATEVDLTNCTFKTRPGNSPPPPDPPLQDVMTMVVTDSVAKYGPVVKGRISAFATVVTDPGYDDNPGHEATGTVVELVSCTPHSDGGGDL